MNTDSEIDQEKLKQADQYGDIYAKYLWCRTVYICVWKHSFDN